MENINDLAKLLFDDSSVQKIHLDLCVKDFNDKDIEPVVNDIFELLLNLFCIGICKFEDSFGVFKVTDDTVGSQDHVRFIQRSLQEHFSKIGIKIKMEIHQASDEQVRERTVAQYCDIELLHNTITISKNTCETYNKLQDMYAIYKINRDTEIKISFSYSL